MMREFAWRIAMIGCAVSAFISISGIFGWSREEARDSGYLIVIVIFLVAILLLLWDATKYVG